jgi:HEPN domain-containing protein
MLKLTILCIFDKVRLMTDTIKYRTELSDYDLETAEAMFSGKRYLYVAFMCHQATEKIFKAFYTKNRSETAPFSHNLTFLAKRGSFYDLFSEEQKEFIDQLEPLNIEARYPTYKERLLKSLTPEKCIELIKNTKDLQRWIKMKL